MEGAQIEGHEGDADRLFPDHERIPEIDPGLLTHPADLVFTDREAAGVARDAEVQPILRIDDTVARNRAAHKPAGLSVVHSHAVIDVAHLRQQIREVLLASLQILERRGRKVCDANQCLPSALYDLCVVARSESGKPLQLVALALGRNDALLYRAVKRHGQHRQRRQEHDQDEAVTCAESSHDRRAAGARQTYPDRKNGSPRSRVPERATSGAAGARWLAKLRARFPASGICPTGWARHAPRSE